MQLSRKQLAEMVNSLTADELKVFEKLLVKDESNSKRFNNEPAKGTNKSTVSRKKFQLISVQIIHQYSCKLCGEVTIHKYDAAIKTQEKIMDVQTLNTQLYSCDKCRKALLEMPLEDVVKRAIATVREAANIHGVRG